MGYRPKRWLDERWDHDPEPISLIEPEVDIPQPLMAVFPRLYGEDNDCVLSAISTLTKRRPADVLRAATLSAPDYGKHGLGKRAIVRTLKRLGYTATFHARRPRKNDRGIVIIAKTGERHAAVYFLRLVVDGDGSIWDFDTWLEHYEAEQVDGLFTISRSR